MSVTAFREGQRIGPHRITRVIEFPGRETRYECRRERCGHVTGKSGARLRTIKAQNPLNCGYCASNGVKVTPRLYDRKPVKNCRRCEGLPHRRPERGACDCGELYQTECIEVETFGYSAIALAQEMV